MRLKTFLSTNLVLKVEKPILEMSYKPVRTYDLFAVIQIKQGHLKKAFPVYHQKPSKIQLGRVLFASSLVV